VAVGITFYRWYCLVRALRIPFLFRDAIRLGFLGYLFNFVALGSTGGDLVKALLLAREQRGRRLEAVATIVVDRMFGVYGLLVVASIAILCADVSSLGGGVRLLSICTLSMTGLGAVLILLALAPGTARTRIAKTLDRLPKVRRPIQRLVLAFQMYRRQKGLLVFVGAMSMTVHVLIAACVFFAARALYTNVPTLLDHFIICPMANVVGALPISPSGLGTYEFAMGYLYDHVPSGGVGNGKGLVVALAFRMLQVSVAGIGIVFYWMNRRQVSEVLVDSERPSAVV
jgi:uncharacterized protein (TIRG00374 family)